MNQNIKTAIFAGLAVISVVLAWVLAPKAAPVDQAYDLGQPMFPEFEDPLNAVTFEVIRFDEVTGDKTEFKVAQKDGLWVLPSHENYPADAEDQMKNAAAMLIGLRKLDIVTGDKSEHKTYGVINPEEAETGDTGVGTLVRLLNKDGSPLARLIIGKEIIDKTTQRYVRIPGQDRIYVTQIDTSDLTTRFDAWINRDLLEIGQDVSIKNVLIDDYKIDEAEGAILTRGKIKLTFDADKFEWNLEGLKEEEELDNAKLGSLRSTIDNLRIVDVARKPEVLVDNLRYGREFSTDLRSNQAVSRSLASKGFYAVEIPTTIGEPQLRIMGNEGELVVALSDGVEYVLRFGEITGQTDPAEDDAKKDDTANDDAKKEDASAPKPKAGSNRYMYVVARFNSSHLTPPDLEPLPELPPEPTTPPTPPTPPTPKPDDNTPAPPTNPDQPKDNPAPGCEDAKDEPKAADDDAPKADTPKEAPPKTDPPKADPPTIDPLPKTGPNPPAPDPAKEAELQRKLIEFQRASIKAENERKQAEFDKKVDDGKKRVRQLNARFAEWYYIIADAEFQKLKLERIDIVRPNQALLNKRQGEAFLAQNKEKPGVVTLPSGVQYRVLIEGDGTMPKATDTVEVKYKGSLIDGTVFDESPDGETRSFQVDGVIPGWTEALQLMKEGSKWQVFIPGEHAYGESGRGEKIGPNAMLIFDVELVKVK